MKNLAASFNQTFFLTQGTCPRSLSNRTGDYIGAQTDPSDFRSFWFAGERATNIGGACQWETRIIGVNPGSGIINFDPQLTGEPDAIEALASGVPVD